MPRENRNTMSDRNAKRPSNAEAEPGFFKARTAWLLRRRKRGGFRSKEASNYTGLSCSTLNKLRCSGGGPRFAKIGRRVVYDVVDLNSWLANHLKTSTSDASVNQHTAAAPKLPRRSLKLMPC